ncbi:MAG: amidohydrolase family protein [Armatimonadetes bacterium]|nr:amidohydrolase family protein [Armatimonadota bacterium]
MSDINKPSGRLRFFDCNARVGRAGAVRPEHILDPQRLIGEMDYCGIERALVYHAWAREWDAASGNRKLLEEIEGLDRLAPCFCPLPHATEEMPPPEALAVDLKARRGAARLYPKEHQYVLSEWCCGRLLSALEDAGVPVLLEMAQASWDDIAGVLKAHPRLPVIVLGTSYRIDRYAYPLWERFDNLHVETATYQVMRGIEAVCRRFGPERLVFGTGLPLLDAGGPIAQVMYAELPEREKRLIAGGTLARLLGVEWPVEGGAEK